jgi:hypothetical protein
VDARQPGDTANGKLADDGAKSGLDAQTDQALEVRCYGAAYPVLHRIDASVDLVNQQRVVESSMRHVPLSKDNVH